MRPVLLFAASWLLFLGAGTANGASTNAPLPFISPIFADNMVLQRDKPNIIWGWTAPKQIVRVTVGGRSAKTVSDADGRGEVAIKPPPVGGPYVVRVEGPQTNELHNVLVGDVWICGGQSNMEFPLNRARNGAEEARAADHPEIRFFNVRSQSA